jgi:hypothetical protein
MTWDRKVACSLAYRRMAEGFGTTPVSYNIKNAESRKMDGISP